MDWVIGMENSIVWVLHSDHGFDGIAASDVEAARMLVYNSGLSLDDEEMVGYDVEGETRSGYTSVRKAAKECGLDIETFLVKALRGQLVGYWIWDCSIEECVIWHYPEPLE